MAALTGGIFLAGCSTLMWTAELSSTCPPPAAAPGTAFLFAVCFRLPGWPSATSASSDRPPPPAPVHTSSSETTSTTTGAWPVTGVCAVKPSVGWVFGSAHCAQAKDVAWQCALHLAPLSKQGHAAVPQMPGAAHRHLNRLGACKPERLSIITVRGEMWRYEDLARTLRIFSPSPNAVWKVVTHATMTTGHAGGIRASASGYSSHRWKTCGEHERQDICERALKSHDIRSHSYVCSDI